MINGTDPEVRPEIARLVVVELVDARLVVKKLVEVALVELNRVIVPDAAVRSVIVALEIVVVASVEVPVTVKRFDTVEVPAYRSTKLPLSV